MGLFNSRLPTVSEATVAKEIVRDTSIAVVAEEHEQLLRELFDNMQRIDPCGEEFDVSSVVWKRWGFQSRDPCSDFRGGGIATLRWFIWLSHKEPIILSRVCREQRELRASRNAELGFPVFVAAINIFRSSLVSQGILSIGPNHPDPDKTSLPSWGVHPYECAVTLLDLTSQITIRERSEYMAFNSTLKEAQQILNDALKRGPKNVLELRSFCKLE